VNEELRNMLAEYLLNQMATPANVAPPQGADPNWNLPQLSLQSRNQQAPAPAISGEYSLPAAGEGDLSVRGDFFRPSAQAPARWGAQVGYHRKF
jgi:hypothetical protein